MFRRQPQALGRLIDDFIESYPHRKAMKRGRILSMWPEIVGPAIAAQAEEPHFKGDKLYVRVKNPAWRHEIHMQRYTIMVKLNQKVNEEIIKEVIVTS